jgi:molybdopterin molybdotransferase
VTFCLFARPFVLRMQGAMNVSPASYWVAADFDWARPDKRREFLRARLNRDGSGKTSAAIFPNQGSGVLTSTVWGDGLIDVPGGTCIARGDLVKFIPFLELVR